MGTGASIAGVGLETFGTRFKGMFIKIRVFKHPKPKSCFDRGEGAANSGAQIYSSGDTLEAASGLFLGSPFPAYAQIITTTECVLTTVRVSSGSMISTCKKKKSLSSDVTTFSGQPRGRMHKPQ